MHRFSKRTLLIFLVCLLLGTVLIGLGMAYVIQVKQRNAVARQGLLRSPADFGSWPPADTTVRGSHPRIPGDA